MSLLRMSMSAAVIICAVAAIRFFTINRLPKSTFLVLWWVVLLRLLIPFSIPSPLSVYSVVNSLPVTNRVHTAVLESLTPITPPTGVTIAAPSAMPASVSPVIDPLFIVWLAGTVLCAVYFAILYISCRRQFLTASKVENDFIAAWLSEHKIIRTIRVCALGSIRAPLTYGVLRPAILIPDKTNLSDTQPLQYILEHEYVHIRRFDAAIKLLLTAAVCIHWFNPFVWLMYALANRDIELSCDEAVVRSFGAAAKSDYALALIVMEEKKSGIIPFCNSFSKNSIKERIGAIMRYKKASFGAIVAAFALVMCITTGFATSAKSVLPENEALNSTAPLEGTVGQPSGSENGADNSMPDSASPLSKAADEEATLDDNTPDSQRLQLVTSDGLLFSSPTGNVNATFDALSDNEYRVNCEVGDLIYPMRNGTITYASNRTNQINVDYGDGITGRYQNVDSSLVKPGELVSVDKPVATLLTVDGVQSKSFVFQIRRNGKSVGIVTQSDAHSEYAPFGITHDQVSGRYYLNGSPARYFEDKEKNIYSGAYDDGQYNVYVVRDANGTVTGLETLDITTDAVDITFREYNDLGLQFSSYGINGMSLNGEAIGSFSDIAAGIGVKIKKEQDGTEYEAVRSTSDPGPVGVGRLISIRRVISAKPLSSHVSNSSTSDSSVDAEALILCSAPTTGVILRNTLPK